MNGYCTKHGREYVWEKDLYYCPQCGKEDTATLVQPNKDTDPLTEMAKSLFTPMNEPMI